MRATDHLGADVRVVSLDTCRYPMLERPEQVAATLNEAADEVITHAA